MSNVIVGFDFSSGSANAVDLAIDVANRIHLNLCLVYVKDKDQDETPIREEIERRNAAVAPLLQGIEMTYVIRQGKVSHELVAQAKLDDSKLIIVGTNGMSGYEKHYLGRNAYRTIAESPVPVITLREDFHYTKDLSRIVVPIDSSPDTRQKVSFATTLAQIYGSELHILGLYTSESATIRGIVDGYVNMVDSYLEKANVKHICKCVNVPKNLTVTTLEYADTINADLIIIMTEQEPNLTSIILGNYAHQMLSLSKRPILSIRPKEINSVAK
ncbi:MAG: universal stress protein [Bacteroidales bacterium]|nr:universal stress protein [Bacteroidales bacterium]